ncbi:MAG: LacI family DNA-binding transcriptional regulator [Anaerolineaceae bacterium]|nr:LacI family DNA-binding transcriptional regulator [Anaerolineaceae bacterium]
MSRKKNPNRGSNLNQVASLAGVSLATASRVLGYSNYHVSSKTRKKVIEAANALNYTPAPQPSAYAFEVNPVIAAIVPTLQNPFFSQVILGIEACASKKGVQVMVFSSHRSVEEERKNINSLLHTRITALIIISIDISGETLENYIACGGKVALLESNFTLPNTIMTKTNYYTAGRLAAEHLISCGHRNIAFFTSPLTKTYRKVILSGVQSTMKEAKLSLPEKNIFVAAAETESDTGLYEFEMGKSLVEEFITRKYNRITAVIAINDLTAFGIIQGFTRHGISIPNDISVISFDNLPYSGMIFPPLTTVELPSVSLGTAACRMLIDTLSGTEPGLAGITFDFQGKLIERESVRHIHSLT